MSAPAVQVQTRIGGLDRLRGAAIASMVIDHTALVATLLTGAVWPLLLRVTVGRIALPVFFVLAGLLLSRLTWRHAGIAGVGLLLPVAVPWVDSPNVLVLYAFGAFVLVVVRRQLGTAGPWVVLGVCLTLLANGWSDWGDGYPFAVLLAMMALGQQLRATVPLWAFGDVGERLPALLEPVGRWPVSWYVGHLLALQWVVLAVGR